MKEWGNDNKGLGATWLIEKAINMLGGNDCNIIEYGSGNGRLLNFILDIGCENVIGYDTNPLSDGRYREDHIEIKDVNKKYLSGDICLAFDFFDYNNTKTLEKAVNNFSVVIGSVDNYDIIDTVNYRKVEGYKKGGYFIASNNITLLNSLESSTVVDFLMVGRFSGITPSVRKVMRSLRRTGYRVFSTIPRSNGNETFKWLIGKGATVSTVLMNNCADWDPQLRTSCNKENVPIITYEDGFIPHYSGLHFDKKGFCWESSFPYENVSKYPNIRDNFDNIKYDNNRPSTLPKDLGEFVFVPLQMIKDSVVLHGSNVTDWDSFVKKIREDVPSRYKLVVKGHPREKEPYKSNTPDILVINNGLGWAIENCEFVVGLNSSVLFESAIIFNKPVYYYGRSWYDRHDKVCKTATGTLVKYDITDDITEYRNRFWQYMKSKQLDYSKGFDDKKLIKLITKEILEYKLL